jgi:hypothetical protein
VNRPPSSARDPGRSAKLEHENQYHRLSCFSDQRTARPAPLQENPNDLTPFATNYFKANPHATDLTPPDEKLAQLNSLLGTNVSSAQKFTFLTQKKTMVYLVHGDWQHIQSTTFKKIKACSLAPQRDSNQWPC